VRTWLRTNRLIVVKEKESPEKPTNECGVSKYANAKLSRSRLLGDYSP